MKYRFGKGTVISAGIGVIVVFSLAKSAEVFKNRSVREAVSVSEASYLHAEESSGDPWIEDYYQDNQEGSGMWAELLYEFGDVVNLKKAGEKKEKPEKEKRIQFRRERQEMRKNKKNNKLLGMKLSKKKLKKMNATLTEMWNSQASDWVKADERKWEFERFQRHSLVEELPKLPDQFAGHEGHEDLAPAVSSLLDLGNCARWRGEERPLNIYFAVQSTLPLHATSKRTAVSEMMTFISELVRGIDIKSNRVRVYDYNDKEDPSAVYRSSLTNTKRKQAKQIRQIQKSTRAKSTTTRPKIKPLIERINKDLEKGEETTLMSGHTNIVVLFITNIPDDLHQVNEEYINSEIEKLNKNAFVIVVFIHPLSQTLLRTVPYRIIPKAWTHGLRDNEYAQRYLVKSFKELTSAKAVQLRESIKNMMCLVDERLQCRLGNRPWNHNSEPAANLAVRSKTSIDSCCGHEIASKAYDSRFKACCRDGTLKSWHSDGSNPCNDDLL